MTIRIGMQKETQHIEFKPNCQVTVFGRKTAQNIGGQIGGQILTKAQNDMLKLIKENNSITREELSERLKINSSAVQKHLDNLKRRGIIERIGKTRGYWKITKK
ncbi:hypothetical protein FACS189415_6050 [Bacteroidia bacterium]|nr:hypothetical protein FACS189426_21320 [Bacteroidia bacterium]GHT85577.1 hypothetical protein FACS18947_4510 [Bacteroidia bacterium]GHU83548.1 hypothetical protein FACS189415_6050 [Bacteroidia bacterium]